MPNALTGDFPAVLQLNGRVIDRLMATLHQNAAAKPHLPSFPHSAFLRIGDPVLAPLVLQIGGNATANAGGPRATGVTDQIDLSMADALDGVRGAVRLQVAVPRVELINGARNRVVIAVPIRARYSADLDTTPLPEFIHGLVRAEYRIREIVIGGGPRRVLRLEVAPNTVTFESYGADKADDARIARQIARVLQTRFAATDHPALEAFRQQLLKSLADGSESAVVVAVDPDGPAQGNLATYTQILVNGKDIAFAVSREYAMSALDSALDQVRAIEDIVTLPDPFPGQYQVGVTAASATYAAAAFPGLGSAGVITISVTANARASISYLPSPITLALTQSLLLQFHKPSQSLTLTTLGAPIVGLNVPGVPGMVASALEGFIGQRVANVVAQYLPGANNRLAHATQFTTALTLQLRTLDDGAHAVLTDGDFTDDGLVLRGNVWLSPRHKAVLSFDKLITLDGYSACPTWLPGGRIDEFTWRWSWFYPTQTPIVHPPMQGATSVSHADRFVMQPQGPLPGFHAAPGAPVMSGAVCLSVRGMQIDPQSGDEIPVDTADIVTRMPPCQIYSPSLQGDFAEGTRRLLSKLLGRIPETVWPEVATIDLAGPRTSSLANALVVYCPRMPDPADLRAVGLAIDRSRRTDAGLLVAIVLAEGAERTSPPSELTEAIGGIPACVLVTVDVQNTWAAAFRTTDGRGVGLRLLTSGHPAWSFDGPVDEAELANALKEHLTTSPLPEITRVSAGVQPGSLPPLATVELEEDLLVPLRALRGSAVVLCFARAGSESSDAQLTRLQRLGDRYAGRPAHVIAVLDMADARAVDAARSKLSLPFHLWADTDGTVTGRWGVRVWPTTVLIDEDGVVERVETGLDPGAVRRDSREPAATR